MRRTVLPLTSMALALLLACGVVLAATAIDCALVGNPCNGTEDDDQITGTDPDPTANITGSDAINGLGGDDQISAKGGDDLLTGGANNDSMDGGIGRDSYRFADSFGADRIEADSSGVDTLDFSQISTPLNTERFFNGITVDLVGPDPPCDTTATYCVSLGGEFVENMVGTPFGDKLTGNSLKNKIWGGDGFDRMNGGVGNDKLLGGGIDVPYDPDNDAPYYSSFDYYYLTPGWGRDTIIDSGGANDRVLPVDDAAAAAMPPLTVNLTSNPDRPEVKDGQGNTINWEGSVIEGVATGAGNDKISQNSSDNNLYGQGGSDIYRGFTPGLVNGDFILDSGGTADVLDLSSFSLAFDTRWSSFTDGSGTNTTHYLQIGLTRNGCLGDNCQYINFSTYFDNTGTNKCTAGRGTGLIETIKFADDDNVDFEQVRRLLGCP